MPRKATIPDDVMKEVVAKCLAGELTNTSAVDYLTQKGFPKVSSQAIQRARERFAAQVTVAKLVSKPGVQVIPVMVEDIPGSVGADIMRLEDIIQTFHTYVEELRAQLEVFREDESVDKIYKANLLRAEIRKNFESEVKAICEKTRLLIERRAIISTLTGQGGGRGNEDSYRRGYKDGAVDAKNEFLKVCKTCKRTTGVPDMVERALEDKRDESCKNPPMPQPPTSTPSEKTSETTTSEN